IGWARALSYGDGWDGWIRFDHGQEANEVYIDSSGDFHGWAWSNAVVGWISFCGKIVSQTCSDGTLYGQCSLEKPKYCDNGKLVNKCNVCGCPSGYSCQEDGSCAIVSQCIGDINNDGEINIYDLAILISHWGQENTADLNNDNIVDLEDVKILLTHWGEICGNQCQVQGDVDNNGEINCDDLDCVLGVILGEKSLEECPCSDVNRDEKINQLDVSKEIDILLSKGIECGKCKQCSDCGKGIFNICDRQECLTCQENCYFIDKTIGGDCLSCSRADSCQDYQDDETTCQIDPCGFGNCKWENNRCVTKSVFQDQRKIKERDIIERTNHGILEEVKNYHGDIQRVLHLWGTHYERGYAHGYLLAKEIPEMFKYTLEIDDIRDISLYNQIKTQLLPKYSFKDKYNQELRGIYDGMIQKLKEINRLDLLYIPSLGKDMDLEDLKMHQLILEVLRYKGTAKSCSGLAIWGDYSKNGHTVLAKSTDFGRGSKEQVCKYHLIVTVDPAENDEVEYFALSWPGFLGTFSAGVNRYGIFVSIITGDEILSDIPIVQHLTPNNLIYKEILEEIKNSSKSSFNNIKDIYEAKTLWPVQDLIALPSQGDSNNAIVMEDGFQIGPFIRWPESELHQKAYDAGITNDKFRIISISSNYYLPETVPYGKGFVDPKMYDYIIEKFENAKNKGRIDVDSMYDVYREAHNESNPYYNNGQGVSAIAADLNNMEFLITQCYPGEIGGWYYQIEPIRYKWDDLFYYK
ncbi:MAG: hypothetical protein DRM98_05765, partial [Thermoplasmata archaeon]